MCVDRAHTFHIFCRSEGKDEKSEGEGKDGKGEKFGIISHQVNTNNNHL